MSEKGQLQPPAGENQLLVERGSKKLAIICFYDIDGTVNNEKVKESERLATISPAKEALQTLKSVGISSGPITSRSFGEAQAYQNTLASTGLVICEDGAVIVLPAGFSDEQRAQLTKRGLRTTTHAGRVAIIVSSVDTTTIGSLITRVTEESGQPMISTLFSPPKEIQMTIGHSTEEAARLSAERIASAYIVNPTTEQERLLKEYAPDVGIRLFGKLLHLIGADAHKGTALQLLHDHADILFPDEHVEGILPIAFGNDTNDVELMKQAHSLGGIGVLVPHPNNDFIVPPDQIPKYVIKTDAPYGMGMVEAIPRVFQQLNQQFGLALQ